MYMLFRVLRYILASGGCTTVIGCRPDDVLYVTLPLYHSVGGMIALAGTMKHGITIALRKKFSANNYWADCVKYRVTVSSMLLPTTNKYLKLHTVWTINNIKEHVDRKPPRERVAFCKFDKPYPIILFKTRKPPPFSIVVVGSHTFPLPGLASPEFFFVTSLMVHTAYKYYV